MATYLVNGSISVLSRSFEGLKFMLLIESKKQYAAPRYAGYYILAQLQVFLNFLYCGISNALRLVR